jgi:hypothetical protein
MPDWGFVRQRFNRGDSMMIPYRGLTFLRVAPHFLPGALTIAVWSNTSAFTNISATAGSSFVFKSRLIYLEYSESALAPCEVTIWKMRHECEYAEYSRNFANGRINVVNDDRQYQICIFLQFPGAVKLIFVRHDTTDAKLELLHMNGSSAAPFPLVEKQTQLLEDSTFAVVADPRASFWLYIESQSRVVDWGDKEGFFADCRRLVPCEQNRTDPGNRTIEYVDRSPQKELVGVLIITAVALATVCVLLFWNAGSELSMGSGMRPLGKVAPLPFT